MNVLITSAGRRVSLARAFRKELREHDAGGKVLTVDMEPRLSPACSISDGSFKVVGALDPSYPERLMDICTGNDVDLVIPTIDTELPVLSERRELFRENGIEVVVSDPDVVGKCADKRKMNGFFTALGISHAREFDKNDPSFPLFVKPVGGSASVESYVIRDGSMLSRYLIENERFMFQEYMDPEHHDEYTVDLYYDRHSRLKCVVPRKRIEVRAGEVSKGLTVKNDILELVWKRMERIEGFRGCITLQVFKNKETGKIIGNEINPRFGGGYPLSYRAGANFPDWLIREYLLNGEIERFDDWEENLLMLRYDAEVFIRDHSG